MNPKRKRGFAVFFGILAGALGWCADLKNGSDEALRRLREKSGRSIGLRPEFLRIPLPLLGGGKTLTAGLFVLLLCRAAQAGFLFEFAEHGATTSTAAFTVAAGAMITIDVLLAEAPGETRLESLGLAGAGVRVTDSGPADAAQLTGVAANSQFDFSTTAMVDSASTGYVTEAAISTLAGSDIYLGSFTFQVPTGATAGEITTLITSLPDLAPGAQDNVLNPDLNNQFGTPIDSLISNAQATITVAGAGPQPVPEPSSLLLVSLGLAGFLGHSGRRRWFG